MSRYTIRDVASLAGVSVSTVSRVINGHSNVAAEYIERVNSAMEKLHFRPNPIAQSMRRTGNQTIGLILPNLTDPFFGSIANHVIANAALYGQSVLILISKFEDSYDELSCFQKLAESSIKGLIYCAISAVDKKDFDQYFNDIPVVLCSRRNLLPGRPHIYFDHQKGGYLATKHLIEMGHRRIAFFVGIYGYPFKNALELEPFFANPALAGPYSGIDKLIGARRALEEKDIPYYPELVEFVDLGNPYESGYLAMQRLVSKTTDFSAVFSTNDLSATGAIHMLNKQKIDVPNTVSVIGYDNGIMATCAQLQLSTVNQDTQALGYECVRALNKLINGEPCSDVLIDVNLVIRQSSCRHTSLI